MFYMRIVVLLVKKVFKKDLFLNMTTVECQ